jgi:hypothetical protein
MKFKLIFGTMIFFAFSCSKETILPENLPDFEKANFSNPTAITNPYYGPAVGKTYTYVDGPIGKEPDEEIIIKRRSETKKVAGILCAIHHDVVYKNGVLIEDTDDWVAQDDAGNLWYLGEFVSNYADNGTFEDNDGSWEADVDEAEPGYWMTANPIVGQKYYQEFLKGEAEDEAEVIEVGATVTIPLGTYQSCLVTKDFTKLEPNIYELKYYAPGIGFIKEEKFINDILTEVLYLKKIN